MSGKLAQQLAKLRENNRRVPLAERKHVSVEKKTRTRKVKNRKTGRYLGWCKECGLPAMEPDVVCPRCGMNPLELLHCPRPPFSFRKGVKIVQFEARNSVGTMIGGAVIGDTIKGVVKPGVEA